MYTQTGRLDVTCDPSLREWRPDCHFIVQALSFLKKIFYVKSFEQFTRMPNIEVSYSVTCNMSIFPLQTFFNSFFASYVSFSVNELRLSVFLNLTRTNIYRRSKSVLNGHR